MARIKFDNRICEECARFWGVVPHCHFRGKHIFNGECLYFEQKEKPISETEQRFQEWEENERMWN